MLISLTLIDLVWAFGLIMIAMALSAWQQLGLEWQLAIAAGRTVVQLIAVGYVLAIVFSPEGRHPAIVLGLLTIMLTIAAITARNRISKNVKHLLPWVWAALLVSTAITLAYVNVLVIRPDPWYEPQYLIPLAGIILGNSMSAAALAGERLVSSLNTHQLAIETHLSLGATPQQAVAKYRKEAIKASLIPTINQMMVVGIVTLPGIITGQLLSGVSPLDAASYQILIMFTIAFTNLMTTSFITHGLCRQCFNQAAQFMRF